MRYCVGFLALWVLIVAPLADAADTSEAAVLDGIRAELVARVNQERSLAGLEPFAREPALDRAAQQAALEMSERAAAPGAGGPPNLSIELDGWLRHAGYDARRAAATAVLTDSVTETALEDLLFPQRPQDSEASLFDPAHRDLGIGLAGSGDTQVIVLVAALSKAGEFEQLSGPLGDLERVRDELLEASNLARREEGRRALQRDGCLGRVAQAYAEEMLSGSFYGHVSPDGLDAFERARVGRCFNPRIAENLAQGPAKVEETVQGWLASPGHRANLLDRKMNRVGFGVAFGHNEQGFQILWVQVLGSP